MSKDVRNAREPNPSDKALTLHPHDVPSEHWQVISVDLIGELPESHGYNAICVVVDNFTKQIHVLPINTTITSEGMARLWHDHVFKLHDTDPQFDLCFMKDLHRLLNIKGNPSTVYHPRPMCSLEDQPGNRTEPEDLHQLPPE